jgi:hypothetical protein
VSDGPYLGEQIYHVGRLWLVPDGERGAGDDY